MRSGLVGQVQGVDPCPLRPVEACGVESDGLVVALGGEVDDDTARGDVLDGEAESRATDGVEDQIELPVRASTTSFAPRRRRSA
jgi:hypothetical protein